MLTPGLTGTVTDRSGETKIGKEKERGDKRKIGR